MKIDEHIHLRDAVFCALDLETTGINPVIDAIIEIGLIRFTMERELESYSSFVNPGRSIPDGAVCVHGITEDMVKDSPAIGELLGGVADFIGNAPLIIHNPRFDLAFLEVAFKKCGRSLPAFGAYDTVRLAQRTFIMPNYKLRTLCENLKIEVPVHRALSDAYACMEVFRRVVSHHDREQNWDFTNLERLHGKVINPRLTKKQKERLDVKNKIYIGDVVKIQYIDENGDVTVRQILPKQLIKGGKADYLLAYCYLRHDDRYFNTRRIMKVF